MKTVLPSLHMISYFIVICLLMPGCNFNATKTLNCDILTEMMKNDQLYREDKRANPMFYLIDSLSGGDKDKHDLFFNEAVDIYKNSKDTLHFTRGFIESEITDSLWKLQQKIDFKNVRTVHKYLEKVEFNRIDTLECFMDAIIVLAHTPEELMPKTISLIEQKKTFIHPNSYTYLKRRLNF